MYLQYGVLYFDTDETQICSVGQALKVLICNDFSLLPAKPVLLFLIGYA
jgi:hypothetical protein